MTQPLAKRFPVPPIASLPEDIRTRLLALQEKSGFISNVFLTLAYRPDELERSSPTMTPSWRGTAD